MTVRWKTLAVNLFIIFIGLIAIELIFGGWFRKQNQLDNFNIYRNRIIYHSLNGLYDSDNEVIKYSRDNYGMRGTLAWNCPEKIDILTIGGSTTDQRYITDGQTWQDVLQNEFQKQGKNFIIGNAGVDGQSTLGYIRNFEVWFPLVPNLSPKYVFFYIGINDVLTIQSNTDYSFLNNNSFRGIKINSVLYNLGRKIQGLYLAKMVYRVAHRKIDFSQIQYVDKGTRPEEFFDSYRVDVNVGYRKRLLKLIEMTEAMGAKPVFITQPSRIYKYEKDDTMMGVEEEINGIDFYKMLSEVNRVIYEVAGNKYIVVELTELRIWNDNDFYDFMHMTPSGAQKVGFAIYEQIKDRIN